jgi:hypothetical protein
VARYAALARDKPVEVDRFAALQATIWTSAAVLAIVLMNCLAVIQNIVFLLSSDACRATRRGFG